MKPPIIFFGTASFSVPTLSALLDSCNVVGVVTKPDTPAGRGQNAKPPEVKALAQKHRVKVLQPQNLPTVTDQIQALQPEIGVVVAYGKIIPPSLISSFSKGLVNIHASLLPLYRGASPIEAAILNDDAKTGVSLMKVTDELDSGPVYAQKDLALSGSETRLELYPALSQMGAELLLANLDQIATGQWRPEPQDDAKATFAPLILKADGVIDWHKPASSLEREIRAYLGWPGSQTEILGKSVTIVAAVIDKISLKPGEVLTAQNRLIVGTAEASLQIERLRPAGKTEMTATDFLRGLRN